MRIDKIQSTGDCANDHSNDNQAEEKVQPEPAVAARVSSNHSEAVQACTTEDQLRDYEPDPKLRLVHAAISANQIPSAAICRKAGDDVAEDGADKGARVHVPSLLLVEEQRRAKQDGGNDNADQDGPSDEHALDHTSPRHGRLQKQRKGPEEELDEERYPATETGWDSDAVLFLPRATSGAARLLVISRRRDVVGRQSGALVGPWLRMRWLRARIRRTARTQHSDSHVGVEMGRSSIRRLWHEEVDDREQCSFEDGDEVERPLPADGMGHFADDDGGQEGASEQRDVAQGHALATLVHEEEIANAGVQQRFERRQPDALNDARPYQGPITRSRRTAPYAANHNDDESEKVEMAFSPDARCRHEQQAGHADAEQMPARQQSHVVEGAPEVQCQRQRVG